jgi:hypothetical protein
MKPLILSSVCTGLLGFTVLVAVSCGGSSESTKITPPVPKKDFSTNFANAYCEGIKGCCTASGITADTTNCKTLLTSQMNAALERFEGKKITFTEAAAGDCIDAYRSALASCTDRDARKNINTICKAVFVGTVPLGGDCSISNECQQDGAQDTYCDAGVCTLETLDTIDNVHAKLGEDCSGTCSSDTNGSGCSSFVSDPNSTVSAMCWVNDGLICSANGKCVAVPTLGESCSGSDYCATGAYCSNSVCVAQIATGSCSYSSKACVSSSYCDYDTNQCTPKKSDGSTCNSDEECVGGDCLDDHCRVWSMATASSCAGMLDD